jgi:replicative DNA helicase Mcm
LNKSLDKKIIDCGSEILMISGEIFHPDDKHVMRVENIYKIDGKVDALSKKFLNSISKKIKESSKDIEKEIFYLSLKDINLFSKDLFDQIISEAEETIQILEYNLSEILKIKDIRIRLIDYDILKKIRIRDIRSEHINKLILIKGYLIQVSGVRPQVVSAKFECPSCGTIIEVLQIEKVFREPSRCTCGRKSQFRLVSKKMIDAQRIVLAEEKGHPENNISPSISVFLKEDLTAPKMNILENIGKPVIILGVLRELPIPIPDLKTISTRFEIAIEANNLFF